MKKENSPKWLSLKNTYGFCWVTLFASFGVGLLVSVFLNIPIGFILGETSDLADGITAMIGTLVTLLFLCFEDGYHHNKFKLTHLILGVVLTFVLQVVITLILGHSVWFTGPTVSFARYAFELINPYMIGIIGAKEIIAKYNWYLMIPTFWLLYAPIMVVGKYLGAKKSKEDFAKAKEEKEREKTLDGHPFD